VCSPVKQCTARQSTAKRLSHSSHTALNAAQLSCCVAGQSDAYCVHFHPVWYMEQRSGCMPRGTVGKQENLESEKQFLLVILACMSYHSFIVFQALFTLLPPRKTQQQPWQHRAPRLSHIPPLLLLQRPDGGLPPRGAGTKGRCCSPRR
jgi:hypothetical protein